jgi:polysaccharide pyruvyl transferase WcaK-like protein
MEAGVLDLQQSYAVLSRMAYARRAMVLRGDYSSNQVLNLVGHAVFAVGMRLHFLIFAALQGVPFVALPYAGKVMGLLQMLDMPALPMEDVNTGQLIAHIDRAWDERPRLKDHICQALPAIKERARESNRIAVELMRKQAFRS